LPSKRKTIKKSGLRQKPSEEANVDATASYQTDKTSYAKQNEVKDSDNNRENFIMEFATQTSRSEEKKNVTYGGTNKNGLHLIIDEQIAALLRKAVRSHLGEELGYNFPFSKETVEV
jgi:hypothetical protein